jgi:hypothetical protein
MSLTPAQLLHALALAQAADVAPALAADSAVDVSYAAGSAATIAGLLLFAANDAASLMARELAAAAAARGLAGDASADRDGRQSALASGLTQAEARGDTARWQAIMALLAAEAAADWAALGLQ